MLTLTNIQKTFGIGTVNEKAALRGIDLHLDAGDFVTVLGSNGAGKSTLFGAIAGAFRLDSGTVVLDGQDITLLPDYKRSKVIGRLFQDPLRGTAPSMTIEENMALAYLRASHSRSPFSHITAADRREFREKLSMLGLGLEDRMDHPVGLLSGGQRQALTLLMATLVTPKLLLLDEPAAGMNPQETQELADYIREIRDKHNLTVLLIEHHMDLVMKISDYIYVIDFGSEIARGVPKDVQHNKRVIEAYLGVSEDE